MTESKKIRFGSSYDFNFKKPPLENWKDMREFYTKEGLDIGDFPVMTEEEKAELAKQLENIK
jgi:hypothetical protein